MFPDYMGIQQNLSDDVGRRVVSHRDRFTSRITMARV